MYLTNHRGTEDSEERIEERLKRDRRGVELVFCLFRSLQVKSWLSVLNKRLFEQEMLMAFIAMFFQVPHEWRTTCTNIGVVVGFGSLFVDVAGSKV